MAMAFADLIAIIYVIFQCTVTLCVSVAGAIYVRKEFLLEKISKTQQNDIVNISKMPFVKLWFKILWKMRTIYGSFFVHIFDVLTDILVITEWWNLENVNGIDHIDSRIMAQCGIAVLVFHRVISSLAFWLKEKNILRCLLQLLDLLIFQEIYVGHSALITQFRNQSISKTKHSKDAIDTSTSFKTVRNLEATFESLPQSILQLVFIVRTNELNHYDSITLTVISILSIIQSTVSMANSILKNDNIFMNASKFKKHRQRLPPTIPFVKHAICRLSEIVSRIGLLSLIWVACGGMAFGILAGSELVLVYLGTLFVAVFEKDQRDNLLSWNTAFLNAQFLILLPSELIFDQKWSWDDIINKFYSRQRLPVIKYWYMYLGECVMWCFCFYPAAFLSTCCCCRNDSFYPYPAFRMGLSLIEWITLISWTFFDPTRSRYLYSQQHGLFLFVTAIICFLIYSQYLVLMPNVQLPWNISVRSRWGIAFNGELEELKRIKPKFPSYADNDSRPYHITVASTQAIAQYKVIDMQTEKDFWEAPPRYYNYAKKSFYEPRNGLDQFLKVTPAMLALSNNNHHVVEWLETEKEVTKHQEDWPWGVNYSNQSAIEKVKVARKIIDPSNEYFKDYII
eukprot:209286_1